MIAQRPRLAAALDSLDVMVSMDIYVNETSRHAAVILPQPSALEDSHYDVAFPQLSWRNLPGIRLSLAGQRPGVNLNELLDNRWRDPMSGNAVLNGMSVELEPVPA